MSLVDPREVPPTGPRPRPSRALPASMPLRESLRLDARYLLLAAMVLFVIGAALDGLGFTDLANSLEAPIAVLLAAGALLAVGALEWKPRMVPRGEDIQPVRRLVRRFHAVGARLGIVPLPMPVFLAGLRLTAPFLPKRAEVDGLHFTLDRGDTLHLALAGEYEPYGVRLMEEFLRPGDLFVDIGAHIGYYALRAARVVGPTGCVLAFEPDPDNFELLVKNARDNGIVNVRPVPLALTDGAGSA